MSTTKPSSRASNRTSTRTPSRSRSASALLDAHRGNLLAEACPSREVLKHLTSRWGVLVLMVLETGTHRFSELRRGIGGVSEKMLAQTLQWLEGDGLVLRTVYDQVPPHVDYKLTPLGRAAAKKVRGLADWIETNLHEVQAFQTERATQLQLAKKTRSGVQVHRLM